MARRAQVRIGPENRVAGRQRDDFGAPGSSEAGDEDALQRLWRMGERHRNECRLDVRGRQVAPERCTCAAGRTFQAPAAPVWIRRERKDAVACGVKAGEERRPGRWRKGWDRGSERTERPLSRESRKRRQPSLGQQLANQVVVGPVESEAEHSHGVITIPALPDRRSSWPRRACSPLPCRPGSPRRAAAESSERRRAGRALAPGRAHRRAGCGTHKSRARPDCVTRSSKNTLAP